MINHDPLQARRCAKPWCNHKRSDHKHGGACRMCKGLCSEFIEQVKHVLADLDAQTKAGGK